MWQTCKNWEKLSNTRYNTPVIRIEGNTMEVSPSLKYLGLRTDKRLPFNEHRRDVRRKTQELANKLLQRTRCTYGAKGAFIRTVVL